MNKNEFFELTQAFNTDSLKADNTSSSPNMKIKGDRVDLESNSTVAATDSNETFVYDASWDGNSVVGADGDVTITNFSLANDKLIILGGGIPLGYDSSQFEANTSGTQQIVVDAINNKTVIYFK